MEILKLMEVCKCLNTMSAAAESPRAPSQVKFLCVEGTEQTWTGGLSVHAFPFGGL